MNTINILNIYIQTLPKSFKNTILNLLFLFSLPFFLYPLKFLLIKDSPKYARLQLDWSRFILDTTNFTLPQNGVLQNSPSYGLGLTSINIEGQLETRLWGNCIKLWLNTCTTVVIFNIITLLLYRTVKLDRLAGDQSLKKQVYNCTRKL